MKSCGIIPAGYYRYNDVTRTEIFLRALIFLTADSNFVNTGTEGILDLIDLYYADTSDWNKEGKAELIAMLNELLPLHLLLLQLCNYSEPFAYIEHSCVLVFLLGRC